VGERDEPEVVGRRVQRLRVERGLTQRQLAEPTYTPAYVSTLEAGRVRPSDEALKHLAERLGVDFEELATGRPERLRVCANDRCRWAFFDSSPTGRRRWCDMRSCGNQAKAARYRARLKEESREEPSRPN
jgi:predicted RNA-binding Zn ribbon-like protein